MLVAALLIWRQSKDQKAAEQATVEAWVQEGVRRAESEREGPFLFGTTEPVAAEVFAAWVRGATPASVAADATIVVTPLGQSFFGSDGTATHHVDLTLQGQRASLEIRWNASAKTGAVIGVQLAQ